jgi:hypothetical protein
MQIKHPIVIFAAISVSVVALSSCGGSHASSDPTKSTAWKAGAAFAERSGFDAHSNAIDMAQRCAAEADVQESSSATQHSSFATACATWAYQR